MAKETFASNGANPYKVKTSWTCTAPSGSVTLAVEKGATDVADLSWTSLPGALYYDVVRGDLGSLRSSGGDFAVAVTGCVADDEPGTSASFAGNPSSGNGFWFLVRADNCGGSTYDSDGATQAFLKEWVHRSVQVGSERLSESGEKLSLKDSDFLTAFSEMRRFSEGTTGSIIGFLGSS